MVKGIPEDIIVKCQKNTIPNNLEKVISNFRKKGLIIQACASKLLDLNTYNDNKEDFEYYMDDLKFCGLLTLENKVKHNVKVSIEEIKKFCNDLLIISGDNVYNCLSTGFQSGIIDNKNILILELDKNNTNKITIQKISSNVKNMEDENEIDVSDYSSNNKFLKFGNEIIKNEKLNSYMFEENIKNLSYDKKKNSFSENLFNQVEFNQNKNYPNIITKKGRSKKEKDITKENSEVERILKRQSKNDFNKNNFYITNKKNKTKEKQLNDNFDKITNNAKNLSQSSIKKNKLLFMKKYDYNYYFKDYEDVKNGIFCISGKLFHYLYENRNRKGVDKFMEKIIKKSKIFFNMSSIEKSYLINYYRDNLDYTVCTMGQNENDIDSIISSNIGISLKNPKNRNTILSHFYSSENDIICIKEMIGIGKLYYENMTILEFISFTYAISINAFILCCLIRDSNIIINQLDFLEIEYFLLLFISFLGNPIKENIYKYKKSKFLTKFYTIISLGLIVIKFFTIYLLFSLFIGDHTFDLPIRNRVLISYFFVLSIENIINLVLNFNFASFYKENPFENLLLISLTLIFLAYIVIQIFLCSSNMSYDILNISFFAKDEKLMDTFSDMNKLYLLLAILIDISVTTFFCYIVKFNFRKYLQ